MRRRFGRGWSALAQRLRERRNKITTTKNGQYTSHFHLSLWQPRVSQGRCTELVAVAKDGRGMNRQDGKAVEAHRSGLYPPILPVRLGRKRNKWKKNQRKRETVGRSWRVFNAAAILCRDAVTSFGWFSLLYVCVVVVVAVNVCCYCLPVPPSGQAIC